MKRNRGFTLTELMVVLGVVALLVTIATPSIATAHKCARATLCQGKLRRIGEVLTLVRRGALLPDSTRAALEVYPDWRGWPQEAQGLCKSPELYKCTEDARKAISMESLRKRVEYRSTYGGGVAIPLVGNVINNFVLSRAGKGYTEYVFEEAGNINQNFWIPGHHNDGWLRLWETGIIEVVDCNCGGDNQLWIDNKPAFGTNASDKKCTQMKLNIGAKIKTNLIDQTAASYGVNTYAHRYAYPSDVIVLMDYDELHANPDNTTKTRQVLLKSRRHLNRLNVLWADGTVRPMGAAELDPLLKRTVWNPSKLKPDPDDAW